MKHKLPFVLEMIWLLVLVASLSAAIYHTYHDGFRAGMMLYVVAFLAALMYASRRYLRKTREKIKDQE